MRLFPKKQEVPFSHLRIHGIHAPPRSLSQLVTTFIGTRAERSPSWVVASHVCIPHHASNPSVSNSCQFGFHRKPPPQGRFSSALPPICSIPGCLSIPPTYHPYMNESVWASAKRTCKKVIETQQCKPVLILSFE